MTALVQFILVEFWANVWLNDFLVAFRRTFKSIGLNQNSGILLGRMNAGGLLAKIVGILFNITKTKMNVEFVYRANIIEKETQFVVNVFRHHGFE
jgi:hypothetical protein